MLDAVADFGAICDDDTASARQTNQAAIQVMFDHMVATGDAIGFRHPRRFFVDAPLRLVRDDRFTQPKRWAIHACGATLDWSQAAGLTPGALDTNLGALLLLGADSIDNGHHGGGSIDMIGQLAIEGPDPQNRPLYEPPANTAAGVYLRHCFNGRLLFYVNGCHTGVRARMSWRNEIRAQARNAMVGAYVGQGCTFNRWPDLHVNESRVGLLLRADGGVVIKNQIFEHPLFEDVGVSGWFDPDQDRIREVAIRDAYVEHREAHAADTFDVWRFGTRYHESGGHRGATSGSTYESVIIEGGNYDTLDYLEPDADPGRALVYREPGRSAGGNRLSFPPRAVRPLAFQGETGAAVPGDWPEYRLRLDGAMQAVEADPMIAAVTPNGAGRALVDLTQAMDQGTMYATGWTDQNDIAYGKPLSPTRIEIQVRTIHDNLVSRPATWARIGGRPL